MCRLQLKQNILLIRKESSDHSIGQASERLLHVWIMSQAVAGEGCSCVVAARGKDRAKDPADARCLFMGHGCAGVCAQHCSQPGQECDAGLVGEADD